MTFILSLANKSFVAQISDRRLTTGTIIVDSNSNKSTVITLADSRFLMGYTGVAKGPGFETQKFLLDTIHHLTQTKGEILPVLEGLTDRLTSEFNNNSLLKSIPRHQRKLTVMFTGYLDFFDPPKAANAIITNYQDIKNKVDLNEASLEFTLHLFNEKRPYHEPINFVQRIGAWRGMTSEHEKELRQLLIENSTLKHILNRSIGIIRNIADKPESMNTIGKDFNTVVLKRDDRNNAISGYECIGEAQALFLPDSVTFINGNSISMKDIQFITDQTTVKRIPRVSKNQPCPCGNGKLYKRCHGFK